jgi:hypothetical protein
VERAPSTHRIGGSVGPRTGLDDFERRKILPLPGNELWPFGRPTCNVASHYPSSSILTVVTNLEGVWNLLKIICVLVVVVNGGWSAWESWLPFSAEGELRCLFSRAFTSPSLPSLDSMLWQAGHCFKSTSDDALIWAKTCRVTYIYNKNNHTWRYKYWLLYVVCGMCLKGSISSLYNLL